MTETQVCSFCCLPTWLAMYIIVENGRQFRWRLEYIQLSEMARDYTLLHAIFKLVGVAPICQRETAIGCPTRAAPYATESRGLSIALFLYLHSRSLVISVSL